MTMVLAQCCDVCGSKFARDISKFCADCGEKRIEQEEDLEVHDEGNMRGPRPRVALQERAVNTLSYIQVFAPLACRDQNKKYGKRALLSSNMGIQHRVMLDNYEKAKKWVLDAQEVGRLPSGVFNLEESGLQERLKEIIKENCGSLQEIKLGKKNHKWDEREIYKYLKHHLRYLRRKKRILENLAENEMIEGEELNDIVNSSPIEEGRTLFLEDRIEDPVMFPIASPGREARSPETEPSQSAEDDESFLLLALSLPTVDVMKKHLRKVMEELNATMTPKPFSTGYRKWDKEKQVKEVAKYYRTKFLAARASTSL